MLRLPTVHREHRLLLTQLLQSHAAGRDLCLIGKAGAGKSFSARLFARALGYAPMETLFVYQDMTARDLLQVRGGHQRHGRSAPALKR